MRWLLAGSSVVAAVGIYVGLTAPTPFGGGNEMAATTGGQTTISATVDSTSTQTTSGEAAAAGTTAVDVAPSEPTVTPTQATPVSRSSGS